MSSILPRLAVVAALSVVSGAWAGSAGTSDLPARKNGLWEITLHPDRPGPRQGQTVLQCTAAKAEPVMLLSIVPGQEQCSEVIVTPQAAGGYDIRTVCQVHANTRRTQVTLRGSLQSAYQGTFEVYTTAKLPQSGAERVAFEGRWLGPCKPGQRPGDMVLPNGVTVNVVDDRQRAQAEHAQ